MNVCGSFYALQVLVVSFNTHTHTHTRSAPAEGTWDSRTAVPAGEILILFKNELLMSQGEETGKGQPEHSLCSPQEQTCSGRVWTAFRENHVACSVVCESVCEWTTEGRDNEFEEPVKHGPMLNGC